MAPPDLIVHRSGIDELDQLQVIDRFSEVLVDVSGIDGCHYEFYGAVVGRGRNPQPCSVQPFQILHQTGKGDVREAGIHDHDLRSQLGKNL